MNINGMSAVDKLCAAIAIVQERILISDHTFDEQKMFANFRMSTASLELAEKILVDLLAELEDTSAKKDAA